MYIYVYIYMYAYTHTHTLDTGNAQSSDLNYSQLSSYVSRRDLRMKNKM